MKYICCFIGGMITTIMIIPMLGEIVSMFEAFAQTQISRWNFTTTLFQKDIVKHGGDSTQAIGFMADWSEEENADA